MMAVISGLPEAVSSHNISEKKTRNASRRDLAYVFDSVNGTTPPQMTWISSGVPITIVLPKPAPAASAPLNFDFGRVVPLDLDRPSW
jgi:hypothetical protein